MPRIVSQSSKKRKLVEVQVSKEVKLNAERIQKDFQVFSPKGKGNGRTKLKPKEISSDIDSIFAVAPSVRAAKRKEIDKQERKERKEKKRRKERAVRSRRETVDGAKPVRVDDEGMRIYSEESLCMLKGGGTAKCPFDCECCF